MYRTLIDLCTCVISYIFETEKSEWFHFMVAVCNYRKIKTSLKYMYYNYINYIDQNLIITLHVCVNI